MKKNIYVTGSRGLVGSRFVELLGNKYNLITPEIEELDITNAKELDSYFKDENIDVIVNFAAFTDVSGGEKERGDENGICWKVNVEAVKNIIALAKHKKAKLIQISTDMVFPGSEKYKGPYSEEQKPESDSNKLTWYGYTKSVGEKMVSDGLEEGSVILRLIYPVRANFMGKFDYLRKPLELYDQEKLYPMFKDQYISISFIDEIINALEKIIDKDMVGIFHAGSTDVTTPLEIITYLIEKVRRVKDAVKPSSLDEFLKTVDNPVRYPKYGGLKVKKTEEMLGIKNSSSKEIVDKLILQGLGK
jgi:dTDP-4-dehydrorhamnose reductase